MRADVVAQLAVIPIEKKPVQPHVDAGPYPIVGNQQVGNGQCRLALAGVTVIMAIGLLPSRRFEQLAVHEDLWVFGGVQAPELLELSLVGGQVVG